MRSRSFPGTLAAALLIAFGAAQIYAAVTEPSTNVPQAIPDATNATTPGIVNSTLNFSVNGTISDVNLTVDISHTWNDDIEIRLASPSVAQQLLWQDCGGSSDNITVTLDQQAGRPQHLPVDRHHQRHPAADRRLRRGPVAASGNHEPRSTAARRAASGPSR